MVITDNNKKGLKKDKGFKFLIDYQQATVYDHVTEKKTFVCLNKSDTPCGGSLYLMTVSLIWQVFYPFLNSLNIMILHIFLNHLTEQAETQPFSIS